MLVGEPAAGVDAELGQRLFDLLIGDAEAAQRRRIRRDAILANLAADRDDLGDARDGEQPRTNGEVGGLADFHRGRLVAGHRDQHDLPHDRADRPHLRHRVRRQLLADQGKPLGDLLPVAIDVGAPVELDIDDREPDAGNRTHARDPGNAVHLGFDRKADELLDFRRRQALPIRS